jgi:hypothetical protein
VAGGLGWLQGRGSEWVRRGSGRQPRYGKRAGARSVVRLTCALNPGIRHDYLVCMGPIAGPFTTSHRRMRTPRRSARPRDRGPWEGYISTRSGPIERQPPT